MELNKIYCEDCRETMKRMPDDFVDLVVTSPPYDDLRDYHKCDWNLRVFQQIADELFRVLKPGGVMVWIVNDKTEKGSETLTSFLQAIYFKFFTGFQMHDVMGYEKDTIPFPEVNRYEQQFEHVFVLSKNNPKTFNALRIKSQGYKPSKSSSARQKDGTTEKLKYETGKEDRKRGNVWRYGVGYMKSTSDKLAFEHPAIFPEKLAADHIYSWSNEGDLIYDPFGGSGTTAKMAHLMQRNWIISEISEKYVEEVTKPRLEPYLKQVSIFDLLNSAS